jgi:hypothetical protein
MGMVLLAHKGSHEPTLSNQYRDRLESTNFTKRGWGEPLSLWARKEWLRSSATTLGTTTLHHRRLGVFIPFKGEN